MMYDVVIIGGGSAGFAAGRVPNSETAGGLLKPNPDGSIKVNTKMETSMPGVYATGDVAGGVFLGGGATPKTQRPDRALWRPKTPWGSAEYNPLATPRVVFTDPPVAAA
ncbi:MAG: FAD-dependent oxidoreductase [Thermoproteus sp.]